MHLRHALPLSSLVALSSLSACGGGGGGASADAALVVELSFPPPVGTTDSSSITVRGTTLAKATVTNVRVNGLDATTTDGFANFERTATLGAGTTLLTVDATDARGRTAEVADGRNVERVPVFLQQLTSGDVGPTGKLALFVDLIGARLLSCNLTSDDVHLVSDATESLGTPWGRLAAVAFAEDGKSAFVLESVRGAIDEVDLKTGHRVETSGPLVGSGPTLVGARDFALVPGKDAAVVLLSASVVFVELSTGKRRVISDSAHGSGDVPIAPNGIAVDLPRNRALTATVFDDTIVAIDLTSGDRTVVAAAGDGLGPIPNGPRDLFVAAGGARAFVLNFFGSIVAMDLASGSRSLVGDSGSTGPELESVFGISASKDGSELLVTEFDGRFMSVDAATGDRAIVAATDAVGAGERVGEHGIALDRRHGRLLLADLGDGPIALDLRTGERTLFSDSRDASLGPAPFTIDAFGADDTTAFAADSSGTLFTYDLATGRRAQLSEDGASGVSMRRVVAFASDRARGRLFALDQAFPFGGDPAKLVAIDRATGARAILSDLDHGAGIDFDEPTGLALDAATGRLFVADTAGIFSVDPATGDRTILSGNGVGAGPAFAGPDDVAFDAVHGRLIVSSKEFPNESFFAVDLESGDRTLLADDGATPRGRGPRIPAECRIALDAAHGVAFLLCDFPAEAIAFDLETADRIILGR